MDPEELKEKCPNLYEELKNSPSISIDEIKGTKKINKETGKEEEIDTHSTRLPSIMDHLLGCETNEEAIEIIDFFQEKNEIEQRLANKLKKQVREKGIRSFGEKREKGAIEKKGLDY